MTRLVHGHWGLSSGIAVIFGVTTCRRQCMRLAATTWQREGSLCCLRAAEACSAADAAQVASIEITCTLFFERKSQGCKWPLDVCLAAVEAAQSQIHISIVQEAKGFTGERFLNPWFCHILWCL